MNIQLSNRNGLDADLIVQLAEADYNEELNNILKTQAKKMNIPGFRPGKIPASVVKRLIGTDAKKEAIESALQKTINGFLEQEKFSFVLSPIPKFIPEEIEWKGSDFEFAYTIGIKPEFEVNLKMLENIPQPIVQLQDAEVQQEVERLRAQVATQEKQEQFDPAAHHCAIVLTELNEEGEPLEEGARKAKSFAPGETNAALATLLSGQSDSFTTTILWKEYFSNEEMADIFKLEELAINDLNPNFKISLSRIYTIVLPEYNQEFFDKFVEPGLVNNLEDFTQEWRNTMNSFFDHEARNVLASRLKNALVQQVEIELPLTYLRAYLCDVEEVAQPEDVADFDTKFEGLVNELRWVLISEKLGEDFEISVSEEEIIDYTIHQINEQYNKMGYGGLLSHEQLRQYAIDYLNKDSKYNQTALALRDGKVFDKIIASLNPTLEPVTLQEFEAMRR